MKQLLASVTGVVVLMVVAAAPAVAGHAYGPAKGHYGEPKAKTWNYGYGHRHPGHGKKYGQSYRKGHWAKPYRGGYKSSDSRGWSKGHPHYRQCHRGMYGHGQKGMKGGKGYREAPAYYQAPASAPQPKAPAPANAPAGGTTTEAAPRNLVETAVAADQFATLVSAVKAAELVETLSGDGPFTVFAPTDEAFNRLPEGTVPGLLNNPEALTKVLTYHVVAGRLNAADLIEQGRFETLNGASIDLGQLKVAQADIAASNGVIHIIDEVLLPPGS
ncbi:MAG: fasciclin domain-containing protein [Chromatiaceae bacterium]|jgi:uncharacterized surface protein with fasciclin (FAS1) repeats